MSVPDLEAVSDLESDPQTGSPVGHHWGLASAIIILTAAVLIGWSTYRFPIPSVNEPHYLTKARHYWNPEWCRGDLFLESSNPHLVFYATVGWLADWLPLAEAAWWSRLLGCVLVAVGWQRLASVLTGSVWGGLLSLPLFLLLQALGNWSGEWIILGTESKVYAYGFLLWALGEWFRNYLFRAAILAGLGFSFHPIVGGWCVIALVLSEVFHFVIRHWRRDALLRPVPLHSRPGHLHWLGAAVAFTACAAPGLYSALGALQSPDGEAARVATLLQVGSRLAHHLDPMRFSREAYRYQALLIVVWGLIQIRIPKARRRPVWTGFVLASLAIAFVGIAAGWGPRPLSEMPGYEWRMNLLKFYLFRLADVAVPIAVSIAFAQWALEPGRSSRSGWRVVLPLLMVAASLKIPDPGQNASGMSPKMQAAWIDACRFLREETLPTDLIQALDSRWTIKWFAERPEYVDYKDTPQDASSILEWNRRLWTIAGWKRTAKSDGNVTDEELADLRRQTGIAYVIARRFPLPPDSQVYRNQYFTISRLPEPQASPTAAAQ